MLSFCRSARDVCRALAIKTSKKVESEGEGIRVECSVEITDLEGDNGRLIEGIVVTCSQCGHEVESYGTGPSSVRRCMALLREECPLGEENFYVDNDG